MTHHRMTRPSPWLWLVAALVLVLVPILGACAPAAPSATATPTKTAYPANPGATPTLPPSSMIPTVSPQFTAQPAGGPTPEPQRAAPSPTPAPSTPRASSPSQAGAQELMTSPDFGVQAFLWWRQEVADRDLGLIRDGGFRWVKQLFSWQDIEGAGKGQFDWSHTDRIVQQAESFGLKLLVRVSADPDRPFWAGFPPDDSANYADLLQQIATRYRGRIKAYQIWNEPNLAREWGGKRPDPAAYADMLKAAYTAIKAADPDALVITAGMAPTTRDDEVAMPDLKYYQGMYDAMHGKSDGYFDLLGAHGTGWAVAPETDPQVVVNDPKLHNNDPSQPDLLRVYAFRHIEDVRALMVRNGDANKQMAILEFGWTTDNRPNSPYFWHGAGAGITEEVKGKYLVQAYQYAIDHWRPWMALMVVIYMPDADWTKNDEQYWWSIIGPGWPEQNLRAAYVELCIYLNGVEGKRCKFDPNPPKS